MLEPAKRLKEKLAAGEKVAGVMASDHLWPQLVELCQRAGLDYLIIDREHGPHGDELVAEVCLTARLAGFAVLLRTVSGELSELRRAVDFGPCGLILPCVETSAQLDTAREALWMPPRGQRRPGGMGNHWMRDFQYETWRDEFEEHFIVVPQIENRAGLENARDLADHPLTTALGLGPYDLSADLGCCWQPDNPDFRAALATVREAAVSASKPLWMYSELADPSDTFLWIGEVSGILRQQLSEHVSRLKS